MGEGDPTGLRSGDGHMGLRSRHLRLLVYRPFFLVQGIMQSILQLLLGSVKTSLLERNAHNQCGGVVLKKPKKGYRLQLYLVCQP